MMQNIDEIVEKDKQFLSEQRKIMETYLSPNIVYHYTTLNRVLDHIIPDMQLRLSGKDKMDDPVENQKTWIDSGGMLPLDTQERIEFRSRIERLKESINHKLNSTIKLISFCKNDLNAQGLDALGCNKLRMWAQYGDKFDGVCIAIKLDKLLEQNGVESCKNTFHGEIKYSSFEYIFENKPRLDFSLIHTNSDDDFVIDSFIKREINNIIFTKHLDFKDENEYRICKFDEENEFSYLDINNAIHGFVVNSHRLNLNVGRMSLLRDNAKTLNCYFTENDWNNLMFNNWHSS